MNAHDRYVVYRHQTLDLYPVVVGPFAVGPFAFDMHQTLFRYLDLHDVLRRYDIHVHYVSGSKIMHMPKTYYHLYTPADAQMLIDAPTRIDQLLRVSPRTVEQLVVNSEALRSRQPAATTDDASLRDLYAQIHRMMQHNN